MSASRTAPRQMAEPPRAAAVAGVIFSVLFMISLVLIRIAVPADPREPGSWLTDPRYRGWVQLALHLVPFVGIAFLWFIAVLRSRVGLLEDQFFATVFFGSGLLFVAMLFVVAAVAGGLVTAFEVDADRLAGSELYYVVRATAYTLMNVFAIKMAGVFMFVTSAIGLRTGVIPRAVAFSGYGLGVVLLLIITDFAWIALLFPLWVLLVSLCVLVDSFNQTRAAPTSGTTSTAPGPTASRRWGQ